MTEQRLIEAREHIAGFLKSKRIEAGMSQQELAEKCDMSVGTISRFENGHFWLVMKQFVLICDALNIDLKKLLDENK